MLLLVGKKSNFIGKFKLKPITIYHIWLLWKCYKKCYRCKKIFTIHLFLVVVGPSMIFYYFILIYKDLTPLTIVKILWQFVVLIEFNQRY